MTGRRAALLFAVAPLGAAWLCARSTAAQPAASPPTTGSPLDSAPLAPSPRLIGLMGRRIFTPDATEIGRVVDMILNAEGRSVAVVVDVGGFLGLGSRRIALAWSRLAFHTEEGRTRIITSVPPDQLSAAPEYRPSDPATVFDPGEGG